MNTIETKNRHTQGNDSMKKNKHTYINSTELARLISNVWELIKYSLANSGKFGLVGFA